MPRFPAPLVSSAAAMEDIKMHAAEHFEANQLDTDIFERELKANITCHTQLMLDS